jgi:hypothetical protein
MLNLDADDIELIWVALMTLKKKECDCEASLYASRKADALIARIEQYLEDVKNGDA